MFDQEFKWLYNIIIYSTIQVSLERLKRSDSIRYQSTVIKRLKSLSLYQAMFDIQNCEFSDTVQIFHSGNFF